MSEELFPPPPHFFTPNPAYKEPVVAYHPTFNGDITRWTPWVRYCHVCRKPIGKWKISFCYGKKFKYSINASFAPFHTYPHVCKRCHPKVNRPGFEHRVPKIPGSN